jgi:transposase
VPAENAISSSCWTTPAGTDRRAWPSVPEGINLVFLPPYSPELQPAEHLWPLVDEPVVNRHFATLADLEAVVAERCRRLDAATIGPHTDFHWWPKPIIPN